MASTLYSQLPLNTSNSEIRTLTVHPSDDHEAPINCSLNVASLNDDCDFEALSYVWHEPSLADVAPVAILINGYDFTPTPNLFSALQHLRLPQKARKLWVDAICINQDNLDERSAQVPLMTRIYMSAQVVAVWLGPSNSDVDTYARLEPQVAAETRLIKDTFSARLGSLSSPADPKTMTELEMLLQERYHKLLELLPGHFFLTGNEYWSRMWTYQECCLPAVSRVFHCGYNQFTWEQVGSDVMLKHIRSWNDCIHQLGDQRKLSGGKRYSEKELGYINSLDSVFDRAFGSGGSLPQVGSSGVEKAGMCGVWIGLHLNLQETMFRKCMNPLDRFYALYGMIQDGFSAPPTVDYTKDVETVSAEVASYLILGGLGALFFDNWDCRSPKASAIPSNDSLPSWVPNFRTTLPHFYVGSRSGVRVPPKKEVISISQDSSTITIQGQSFGPARILARFNSSPFDRVDLFVRRLGQTLSSLAATPEPELLRKRIARLVTVLLFDENEDLWLPKGPSARDTLVEFLLRFHSDSLRPQDETPLSTEDLRQNLRLPESSIWSDISWHTILRDQTEVKFMFVTDDLHMGFCGAQIRDGDIVARLGNQRGSCVLRRCGKESPGNPLEETVTMIAPSVVRHLPSIWDADPGDDDTWCEDMTVDEMEPVVFTIR